MTTPEVRPSALGFALRLLRRTETRALLIWLAAAASIWGFLAIADEIGEGETEVFDRRLILLLRTPGDPADPLGSRSFEEAMRDVTALGGFTLLTLLTIVSTLAFLFHRKRLQAGLMLGTMLLAQATSDLLKELYGRPRPGLVPHEVYVYSGSFPSGHSTLSAAAFLTLATLVASLEPRRATKVLVYAVAMLVVLGVGVSRIYLGVHWPSDVLGGWCVGAAWAFAAWIVLDWARRRALRNARPSA